MVEAGAAKSASDVRYTTLGLPPAVPHNPMSDIRTHIFRRMIYGNVILFVINGGSKPHPARELTFSAIDYKRSPSSWQQISSSAYGRERIISQKICHSSSLWFLRA